MNHIDRVSVLTLPVPVPVQALSALDEGVALVKFAAHEVKHAQAQADNLPDLG